MLLCRKGDCRVALQVKMSVLGLCFGGGIALVIRTPLPSLPCGHCWNPPLCVFI